MRLLANHRARCGWCFSDSTSFVHPSRVGEAPPAPGARAESQDDKRAVSYTHLDYCKLYDLAKDPMETSPSLRGSAFVEMKARYDAFAKTVKEVTPYGCTGDCLDAAHKKK